MLFPGYYNMLPFLAQACTFSSEELRENKLLVRSGDHHYVLKNVDGAVVAVGRGPSELLSEKEKELDPKTNAIHLSSRAVRAGPKPTNPHPFSKLGGGLFFGIGPQNDRKRASPPTADAVSGDFLAKQRILREKPLQFLPASVKIAGSEA